MMQERHALRARVRAAEQLAFQRVRLAIHCSSPAAGAMKEQACCCAIAARALP